jgi:hypothetical protein
VDVKLIRSPIWHRRRHPIWSKNSKARAASPVPEPTQSRMAPSVGCHY